METIHYISDFTWFSGKKVSVKYGNILNVLKAHISYIIRLKKDVDNVFTFNLNIKDWLDKAKREISKRYDSRVALKFVIALPVNTNENNVDFFINLLKDFLSETFNVNPENVGIAIHLEKGISGKYNPHAHVLIFPRDKNGRKLRLNRSFLSSFHKKWIKLLDDLGYRVKKNPEELRIPHLGTKLYYDEEAQELYKSYWKVKKLNAEREKVKRQVESLNHSEATEVAWDGREEEFEVKEDIFDFFKRFLDKDGKDFRDKQRKNLALHFQRLGYRPNDKLAVVLVNHKENKVLQRVFTVEQILSDKVLAFLSAKNVEGYSVYASVNVLKDSAKRRRKEDFKPKQKRLYLDLDSKNKTAKELLTELYKYLRENGLPDPTHIVKSSKGNYQVYWLLSDEVEYEKLEKIMERMNMDLGLDHTQDVSRVFRLPYFRNKKPNKNDLVLNIDRLDVNLKEENLKCQIVATGNSVSLEPFENLLKEIGENLKPKPLVIKKEVDISEEIETFKRKIRKSKEKRLYSKLISSGYSDKVASYYIDFMNLVRDFKVNEELKELFFIAFERQKDKSPSEVDISFVSLAFSRYNGKIPKNLKDEIIDLLGFLGDLRGKYDPYFYARLTYEKAEDYWKKHFPSTLQNKPSNPSNLPNNRLSDSSKGLDLNPNLEQNEESDNDISL